MHLCNCWPISKTNYTSYSTEQSRLSNLTRELTVTWATGAELPFINSFSWLSTEHCRTYKQCTEPHTVWKDWFQLEFSKLGIELRKGSANFFNHKLLVLSVIRHLDLQVKVQKSLGRHKIRCEKQVTSHKSHDIRPKLWLPNHKSWVTGQKAQVTSHKSWVTSHKSWITSHKSQVMSHESRVMSHES